jgi:hypothetical protein
MGMFWKRTHFRLPFMLAGVGMSFRNPLWLTLAVPWVVQVPPRHGGARGRMRHLLEMPGCAAIDIAEVLALAKGSVKHRAVFL